MTMPAYGVGNQTQYPLNSDRAFAGMPVQTNKVDSYINSAGTTQQTVAIAIGTAANSTAYTVTGLGQTISITSGGSATGVAIGTALAAAIQANSVFSSRFSVGAVNGSTGNFTLTSRLFGVDTAVAVSGGGAGYAATNNVSARAANIAYGLVVAKSGILDGVPMGALPTGASDVIAGIAVATTSLPAPDAATGDAIYRNGDVMAVMARGVIWAIAEEAVATNSSLFFRHGSGTLGVIAASSGTGKAALPGCRPAEPSITLRDGTILVKVEVNIP